MTLNPHLRYKNLRDIIRSNRGFLTQSRWTFKLLLIEALMNLNVNDKAPDFTLQDENGKEVSLKSLRGKVVVLYFYPRADTPGCTVEACAFRDTYKQMQKTGAVLLGVSPDTPKAQKKFQDKFQLPFSLLADADKKSPILMAFFRRKTCTARKLWASSAPPS